MKKSLLLCSTIALMAIITVSCTKKTESPAPNLTGYYQGTYKLSNDQGSFLMFIKDDNTTTSIRFDETFLDGSLTIKTNTFTGKFYGETSKPLAFIEGGTINGTGKNIALTGTLKYDNKVGNFAVTLIGTEEPEY